tara:strand:- start:51 stop:221 length:171 start_codon:yes stop_codon:yes gene_type:complete
LIEALDLRHKATKVIPKRGVIGIGAGAYYTLYDVGSDKTHFLNVLDQPKSNTRGFG